MRSGFPAEAAISLIRQERDPVALCNEHFEQFLLEDAAVLLTPTRSSSVGKSRKGVGGPMRRDNVGGGER